MSIRDPSCKHNFGVTCSSWDRCYDCGWNPEVDARRKRELRGQDPFTTEKEEDIKTLLLKRTNENVTLMRENKWQEGKIEALQDQVISLKKSIRDLERKLLIAKNTIKEK